MLLDAQAAEGFDAFLRGGVAHTVDVEGMLEVGGEAGAGAAAVVGCGG